MLWRGIVIPSLPELHPAPAPQGAPPPAGLSPRRFNQRRAGSAPGDARGEAPCIRKLRFSPFPGGEGGRGMGARKLAKGRVCRRQRRQAPHPSPEHHPAPAPQGAQPPAASTSAARVQSRGCKGRSPLHEITLNLPLPAGKSALRARAGGWGKKLLMRQKKPAN